MTTRECCRYRFALKLKTWVAEHPASTDLARQVMANEFHRMLRGSRDMKRGNSHWHTGTTYVKHRGKWQAAIKHHGRDIWLGYFPDERSAADAYEKAVVSLRGQAA